MSAAISGAGPAYCSAHAGYGLIQSERITLQAKTSAPQWQSHRNADSIHVRSPGATVNNMPRVSVTVLFALVAVYVKTLTAALGACKTTLHGELVAYDDPKQLLRAVPQKWLSFSLSEIVQENRHTVAKNFQSFTFPNAKTTFPIPFALNIDSPKDCPKELQLHVTGSDRLGFHYEFPLNGLKKINLEKFESIRVGRPSF
jgi:hypothetical protein